MITHVTRLAIPTAVIHLILVIIVIVVMIVLTVTSGEMVFTVTSGGSALFAPEKCDT